MVTVTVENFKDDVTSEKSDDSCDEAQKVKKMVWVTKAFGVDPMGVADGDNSASHSEKHASAQIKFDEMLQFEAKVDLDKQASLLHVSSKDPPNDDTGKSVGDTNVHPSNYIDPKGNCEPISWVNMSHTQTLKICNQSENDMLTDNMVTKHKSDVSPQVE